MGSLVRVIDIVSDRIGRIASWFIIALVLSLVIEVVARYAFNSPTIWSFILVTMLGASIVVLGLAHNELHGAHIRIDFIYARFTHKGKALFDLILAVLFLFPLLGALTYTAAIRMMFSWEMNEVVKGVGWYPPAGPMRTVVFVGLALFWLQGLAGFIRNLYLLLGRKLND